MRKNLLMAVLSLLMATTALAQDPNFYIYLCIGQSNMEGNGVIEPIDRNNVPENFQMMACVNFNNPKRTQGEWYKAVPPLVREGTGLGVTDWFGRTMVDNLGDDIKVGVLPVAVGGAKIEHLDKDYDTNTLKNEAGWFQSYMAAYGNKPYDRLIECAKKAQQAGVIKGILLHQGESNNGQSDWPKKVKKLYEDILGDLNLNAEDVPLLVGQTVTSDMGGACGWHNTVVAKVPEVIPTAHVVSAANLEHKGDGLHFTSHAYRVLGCRYASTLLKLMGVEDIVVNYAEAEPYQPNPEPSEGDFVFDMSQFKPTIWEKGTYDANTHTFIAGQYGFGGWEFETPIDLSGYKYLVAELEKPQTNGACFRVFDTASYWEQPFSVEISNNTLTVVDIDGMMKPTNNGNGIQQVDTKKIYRVGFWAYGGQPIVIKHVFATNNDPYGAISSISTVTTDNYTVYNMQGMVVMTTTELSDIDALRVGMYIVNGKKLLVR